jgi:hypothetical protein
MNGHQLVNGFEFNKYAGFNEIVHSESGLEPHLAVPDWKLQLVFEMQTRAAQFVAEAHVVGFLEKARAKPTLHGDRGSYDSFGDVVDDHHAVGSAVSSASSAVDTAVQELSLV